MKACAAAGIAIVPAGRQHRHVRAASRRVADTSAIVARRMLAATHPQRRPRLGDTITVDAGVHPRRRSRKRPTTSTACSRSASALRARARSAAISPPMPAAPHVLRYGTTRELALGLEVVLPDGRDLGRPDGAAQGHHRLRHASSSSSAREGTARHHHRRGAEAVSEATGEARYRLAKLNSIEAVLDAARAGAHRTR